MKIHKLLYLFAFSFLIIFSSMLSAIPMRLASRSIDLESSCPAVAVIRQGLSRELSQQDREVIFGERFKEVTKCFKEQKN
jgi:hypothetical protein